MKLNMKVLTLYAAVVLLCLSCFTSHLIGKTYARYVVSDSSWDSARVAAFGMSIVSNEPKFNETQIIDIGSDFRPGSEKTYTFRVDNSKSEVAVAFSVTANNLTGNLPIVTQLTGNNVDTTTGKGYLAPNSTGTFTFTISWEAGKTSPSYAGQVDLLQLTIKAEQVD